MSHNKPRKIACGRRAFLRTAALGSVGTAVLEGCSSPMTRGPQPGKVYAVDPGKSSVAFAAGDDRIGNLLTVLGPFEDHIRDGIRGKQVVVKLNCVGQEGRLLMVTHPDAVRAVLEFLTPLTKERIIVAESAVQNPGAPRWIEEYGYREIEKEYNTRIVELNNEPTTTHWIVDRNLNPVKIRVINTLLDSGTYVISLTRLKTHSCVVATLTLKNIVMGAPLKIPHLNINDKAKMHADGNNPKLINFNLFRLAQKVRPDFAVLDGFEGVEGNGPANGTSVDHRVALAGPDFLAVDRMGLELMGIPYGDVGYMNYCAAAGLGQADLSNIRIIGPDYRDHVKKYRLHDNIEKQLRWKNGLMLRDA